MGGGAHGIQGTVPPVESLESWPDGDWVVRPVTGAASTKSYRCPGCDQEIRPATPHLVVWPDGELDDRRHWHKPCWRARGRRGVSARRSRPAPGPRGVGRG
ncbi:MAG: hypothetical protein M3P91_02510 [Actinomycetota bacterium]|nr:hypothetical protein [Actinomycetota bacterium]